AAQGRRNRLDHLLRSGLRPDRTAVNCRCSCRSRRDSPVDLHRRSPCAILTVRMWSLLRPPTFLEVLLIAVLSMGQLTPQQTGPQLALGAVSTPEAGLTLQVKRSGAAAVSNSGLGTSPVALSTSPTATVGWGVLNTTWSTDTNDALQLRTNASGNTGLIEMGAGTYKNANTQSGVQQFFQPTARAWGIFPGNQLGGFLNVHLGTNGSASSFVQAITELTGLTGTGPGTGGWSASNYANAEYDYAATTGDANYHNAYGDGMEAIYSAGFTHY